MGAKTRTISNFLTNTTGVGPGLVFLAEYDGSGSSSHSIGPSIMTTDYESFYIVYRATQNTNNSRHYRVTFKNSGGTTINTYNTYTYDQWNGSSFGRGGNGGYGGHGGSNASHALLSVNNYAGDLVAGSLWVHNSGMAGGSGTHRNRFIFSAIGTTHQNGFSSIQTEQLNAQGHAATDGACQEVEFSYSGGENISYNIKIYGYKFN